MSLHLIVDDGRRDVFVPLRLRHYTLWMAASRPGHIHVRGYLMDDVQAELAWIFLGMAYQLSQTSEQYATTVAGRVLVKGSPVRVRPGMRIEMGLVNLSLCQLTAGVRERCQLAGHCWVCGVQLRVTDHFFWDGVKELEGETTLRGTGGVGNVYSCPQCSRRYHDYGDGQFLRA